jgi:hypothetical protein
MPDQMQETVPGRARSDLPANILQFQLPGGLMFSADCFVLGGNFWEKSARCSSALAASPIPQILFSKHRKSKE